MSSLDQYIRTAALAALNGAGSYLRETAAQANLDTSTALPAPYIVCGDLTVTTVITPVGKEFDSTTATLYFGDVKPGMGDSPEEHDAACLRMELLQRRFFAELNDLERPASGRRRTEMRDIYAAMLDGFGVQFTLAVPAGPPCVDVVPTPVPVITDAVFTAV